MKTPIFQNRNLSVNRNGRFIIAELLKPHQVFSTSFVNGGQSESIRFLVNHQSSEGKDHSERAHVITDMGQDNYHQMICKELNIDPEKTAMMSTAANMQYAFFAKEIFEEIAIYAITTAGVTGNAGTAGDFAKWHEGKEDWQKIPVAAGTIVTMLFINWPLSAGALVTALMTMTEAKTAALHELAVSSKTSDKLATGTGTDQVALAALIDKNKKPKAWTGKHTKLGELIAKAVIRSTKEALRWQNGLEPSLTRSLVYALERFGISDNRLREKLKKIMSVRSYELFEKNFKSVVFDPQIAACAYAIAGIQDRFKYGTLPISAVEEVTSLQCALLASQLAAKPQTFHQFQEALSKKPFDLLDRVCLAISLGWDEKWK